MLKKINSFNIHTKDDCMIPKTQVHYKLKSGHQLSLKFVEEWLLNLTNPSAECVQIKTNRSTGLFPGLKNKNKTKNKKQQSSQADSVK